MPDKYIVNMTAKTTPEDTNLLVIEDAVDTKKITFANLFNPIKTLIGNLASLTTSHKSTLVGAINEIQANNSLHFPNAHTLVINNPIYQGSSELVKNSSATADYGTLLINRNADGSSSRLILRGRNLQFMYTDTSGTDHTTTIATV